MFAKIKKLFTFKKMVDRGCEIPPFYGIVYRDYYKDEKTCYPLGINLIIILWDEFVHWLKFPKGHP